MRVTVIGAGISGLSVSHMLKAKHQVEILEKQNEPGGLIKCDRINGNLFHRVGGHVFNSKNADVLNWFWSHFNQEDEFLEARRNAKIWLNSQFIGYPIENYIYQLDKNTGQQIILELIELLQQPQLQVSAYKNFKDFLRGNFGMHLYNLYFAPYNSKIWNTDLEQVPLPWLDGKLPMPNIAETLLSNIIREEEDNMVHSTFYYPKINGSQFLVDRFSKGLFIQCNYIMHSLKYIGKQLLINNEKSTDVVIYCGDVRKLNEIIQIDDTELKEVMTRMKELKSNGTSNVLCETDTTDISWLYLPEEKYKAHRIIYTGNFSESNNSTPMNRKTCVVEFSGKQEESTIRNEIQKLPGNLKPIGFNYEPNSYVIQRNDTRVKISKLKELLEKYNIYLLGRFAEWEYYNMDKCIESAMKLTNTIT